MTNTSCRFIYYSGISLTQMKCALKYNYVYAFVLNGDYIYVRSSNTHQSYTDRIYLTAIAVKMFCLNLHKYLTDVTFSSINDYNLFKPHCSQKLLYAWYMNVYMYVYIISLHTRIPMSGWIEAVCSKSIHLQLIISYFMSYVHVAVSFQEAQGKHAFTALL